MKYMKLIALAMLATATVTNSMDKTTRYALNPLAKRLLKGTQGRELTFQQIRDIAEARGLSKTRPVSAPATRSTSPLAGKAPKRAASADDVTTIATGDKS